MLAGDPSPPAETALSQAMGSRKTKRLGSAMAVRYRRLRAHATTDAMRSPDRPAADRYRPKVEQVQAALKGGDAAGLEAIALVRELIRHVRVIPTADSAPIALPATFGSKTDVERPLVRRGFLTHCRHHGRSGRSALASDVEWPASSEVAPTGRMLVSGITLSNQCCKKIKQGCNKGRCGHGHDPRENYIAGHVPAHC